MPAPGSRLPSTLEISPAENMLWATVPLNFACLGESLVEMGGIGIARDGGVELDVLLGDGPLEAGALAERDLVEGAVLDQIGLSMTSPEDCAIIQAPIEARDVADTASWDG